MIPRLDLEPPPSQEPPELVDTATAARRLGVRRQTVSMWVVRGYLGPVATLNKRSMYLWSDVKMVDLATRRRGAQRRAT